MKQAFIENMLKAKKYEALAFASLLPEPVKPHIEIIQKEMCEMIKECLSFKSNQEKHKPDSHNRKVHKVEIK